MSFLSPASFGAIPRGRNGWSTRLKPIEKHRLAYAKPSSLDQTGLPRNFPKIAVDDSLISQMVDNETQENILGTQDLVWI